MCVLPYLRLRNAGQRSAAARQPPLCKRSVLLKKCAYPAYGTSKLQPRCYSVRRGPVYVAPARTEQERGPLAHRVATHCFPCCASTLLRAACAPGASPLHKHLGSRAAPKPNQAEHMR
jgi:hypothetical protein